MLQKNKVEQWDSECQSELWSCHLKYGEVIREVLTEKMT